jgi:hypothetical protein
MQQIDQKSGVKARPRKKADRAIYPLGVGDFGKGKVGLGAKKVSVYLTPVSVYPGLSRFISV